MRRRQLLHFALWLPAAALGLAACGRRSPKLPRIDSQGVVLAFGDSLTFGTGAKPEESYPAVLEKLIGRKVVRSGVPGETAAEGFARLPDVLKEAEPALVILCEGGNDLLRRAQDASVKTSLQQSIELIRERGAAVVLMAPPRPGVFTDIPAFYVELAKEQRLPLEGEILKSVLSDNALKSDLIHPNAKGYAKIAEALAKLLKDAGAV
jgi:lysophospholipase L1-like esterase